jgi:CBS domain-containing protein
MSTAGEIMHRGAECIGESDTLESAARKMRDLQVGALPICGDDNKLHGIITDRDIVVKCIAEGKDARSCTAGELAQGTPVWVEASTDTSEVLHVMEQHKIRRVPVIENHQLVGMISEADVATHLPDDKIAEFVERIYTAPPTS